MSVVGGGGSGVGFPPRERGIIVQRPLPNNASRRWRYMAQNALTGEWIDRSGIPVLSDQLTWDLSTGALQGTIDPQYYGLTQSGSSVPKMDEWGTFIYAECDGEIQWGGILTVSNFTGSQWQFQASGFRAFTAGQVFTGNYSQLDVDPLDVVSFLWAWLQSQANASLGVAIAANVAHSKVRLGTGINPTFAPQISSTFPKSNASVLNNHQYPVVVAFTVPGGSHITLIKINGKKVYEGGTLKKITLQTGDNIAVTYTGSPSWTWTVQVPAPYKLDWWNGPDIGQELSTLATATPFDMVEAHNWNADKTDVNHSISIGYPRVGQRRNGLRFVEGENIVVLPQLSRDGTQYSNGVVAFGSGSGSSTIHWESGLLDATRLRRTYSYTNTSITHKDHLASVARKDINAKMRLLTAQTIQVADHPHAPFGHYHEGDDILLQFTSGWMAGQQVWHRIIAINYSTTTNTLVLSLARSDSFSYQGDLGSLGRN